MGFNPSPSDPFIELMRPPPDETPAQTTARQKRELDAQRVSDKIDEEIKQERLLAKKEKNIIKVLLLGQSESGKSTTLKNFRMRYAQAAWEKERDGWRSVVQLNIVRSIITILGVVDAEMNGEVLESEDEEEGGMTGDAHETVKFSDKHQMLMIRLAPLRGVEAELKRRLGAGTEPIQPSLPMTATPFDDPADNLGLRRTAPEFSVRSWKEVLDPGDRLPQLQNAGGDSDSVTLTIAGCKDDMKILWDDKMVRLALKRRKLRLPDSAGFFLNDLERIATRGYTVSDNDIVRARLRTVGIQEHRLKFQHGPWDNPKQVGKESGWEWRIFDVGGCRTSRAAWLPFFDNVNVIIFLSPVSVFDQRLEEDPRVNRLEDSIILWTSICSSKLLAKTQLILFLNKCDLLRRKLKRGIKVNIYLPSYGDRPNEVIPVVKYFREKFKDIQKQYSPQHRSAYIYPTTVTDTEATAITLESVRDGVLRENLATSQLI
ncbi:heterotrimeric G protein alpha subunit [Collybia nuda]|uniref:Heterotrimeric G protein alpha subunit n=1 Tax=Collybia nuda TaxID=64659 RepID=A0A9P6CPI4_9AGAR|nr:heterotrimeric G protein alpha subunit [Collybia nuda]